MKQLHTILCLLLCISFNIQAQKANPFSINFKKSKNNYLKNFSYIPSGVLLKPIDPFHTQYTKDIKKSYTTIKIDSFYISSTEVSNEQYREFINELKSKNDTTTYRIAFVDSTNWEKLHSYNEPFKMHYFNHPAYNYYPCVCISYEGAVAYCSWLTKKINESQTEYEVEVKLPSADQWEYAARGGIQLSSYSWGGPKLQNEKGCTLCNYQNLDPSSIHYNHENNQYEIIGMGNTFDVTAPVLSYMPNAYGLYNTCGNVAEMVDSKGIARGGSWQDPGYDVRISSEKKYESSSASIGFRPMMIVRKK